MNVIQFLADHPHAFTVIWAVIAIVSAVLVWDVGKEEE